MISASRSPSVIVILLAAATFSAMSPWIMALTTAAWDTDWPSSKMADTPSTASSTCCWVILELPTYAATLGSALAQPAASSVTTNTPRSAAARTAQRLR